MPFLRLKPQQSKLFRVLWCSAEQSGQVLEQNNVKNTSVVCDYNSLMQTTYLVSDKNVKKKKQIC